jgi:hypothetical protein
LGGTALLADNDIACAIRAIDSDVKASLALSRATLRIVASLSPSLHAAADTVLEAEADNAFRYDPPTAQRVFDTIEDARSELRAALAEALMVRDLERALIDAADVLPDAADLQEPVPLRAFG